MATNYNVLEYTINSLVDELMKKYNLNYDTSMDAVMNSDMYGKLLDDESFLEEGDIYLFNILEQELTQKKSLTTVSK